MKTKTQKKAAVDTLATALPGSTITIFTTFARKGEKGLSVSQMQELKRALRQAQGEYLVAKKTLVEKVLEQLKYSGIDPYGMEGSVGLVVTHGDAYATAKALHQFAKAHPALKMFTAWMNNTLIGHEALVEMATLPGREELLARLLGMLKYPLSSLAIVLNQVAQQK